MPLVTVVGSLNLDVVVDVRALPGPGDTVIGEGPSRTGPGGKGANQAAAAAAVLGPREVAMVGMVGSDEAGAELDADLSLRGVDLSGLGYDDALPTGRATVVLDPHGENLIVVEPGANAALSPDDVRCGAVADAAVLLVQLEVPVATVLAAVQHARGTVVLDPAPVADLADLLPHVDVLVPNRTELATLVGGEPAADVAGVRAQVERLAHGGAVVVTLGPDGVLVVSEDEVVHLPAPAVDVVDTTGAGDCFCGVLAAGLAHGATLIEAATAAVAAAAGSVTRAGAR